jgi:hypothetical protein
MQDWNWIEVLWTLVALVGAYFSLRNIIDGWQDLKVLDDNKPDDNLDEWELQRVAAKGTIRRDGLRFGIQSMFTVLGLLAGFGQVNGALVVTVLMLASLMLTISAASDYLDRIRFLRDG